MFKKIIILFLSLFLYQNASTFDLSKEDLKVIENTYENKKILKRFENHKAFLKEAKTYSLTKKLNRVNYKINKIISKQDKVAQNSIDHWSTPKEFFVKGVGDCEDYAIAKYFTLQELGIKKSQIYMAIVRYRKRKNMHMVMMYFKNKKAIPLILDNLSWKVLPLNKRKDLTVKVIFNEKDSYIMKNYKIDKKVNINWGGNNKWKKILDKIKLNK